MSDLIHLNSYGNILNTEQPRAFYEDYDDDAQQQRRKERLQRKKKDRHQSRDVVDEEPDLDELLSEPKKSSKKKKKKRKNRDYADVALEDDPFDVGLENYADEYEDYWSDDVDDNPS